MTPTREQHGHEQARGADSDVRFAGVSASLHRLAARP